MTPQYIQLAARFISRIRPQLLISGVVWWYLSVFWCTVSSVLPGRYRYVRFTRVYTGSMVPISYRPN